MRWAAATSRDILPPENVDAYFKLDYFSERNFAGGFNLKYEGGFITETTRQPWDFQGDFKSYFLPDDKGTVGYLNAGRRRGRRLDVTRDEQREESAV